jgi:hypothetical protein
VGGTSPKPRTPPPRRGVVANRVVDRCCLDLIESHRRERLALAGLSHTATSSCGAARTCCAINKRSRRIRQLMQAMESDPPWERLE